MKSKENWWSYVAMMVLALALPMLLRGITQIQRTWAGAEGRLAAIDVQTDQVIGPLPRPWQALAQGGDELTTFMDKSEPQIKALVGYFS